MKKLFLIFLMLLFPLMVRAETPFKIILFPDIQYITNREIPPDTRWPSMYNWVITNKTTENIKAVIGLGDNVDAMNASWFTNAKTGWVALWNQNIPAITVMGNHDYDDYPSHSNQSTWDSYFTTSLVSSKSWYGGAYNNQLSNWYIKFSANKRKFLIIGLEYIPSSEVLTWVQGILNDYKDRETIIVTHDYMVNPCSRSTVGNNIWNSLIKSNSQIFLVVCGHWNLSPYHCVLNSTNDDGKNVAQVWLDYQDGGDSGSGLMGILTFDPDNSKIIAKAYSNWTGGGYPGYDLHDPAFDYEITYTNPTSAYLIDGSKPGDIKIGSGNTTAHYIDRDGDGYGIGEAPNGVDADDTDEDVNTLASVETKYGSLTSGENYLTNTKNFFCTVRGSPYCEIGNIWYLDPTGNNSTGVVNDITHPFATLIFVFNNGFTAGDIILLRAGEYSEYWDLEYGIPGGLKDGASKTKPNIIAAMPGELAINKNNGNKVNSMNNWYWVFDGLQMGSLYQDTGGNAFQTHGLHNAVFKNLFIVRNANAQWMQQGSSATCKETITVIEDLNGDGVPEERTLSSCKCPTDILMEDVVAAGNTGSHQFYWGCNPGESGRPSCSANVTVRRLISHSPMSGDQYECWDHNGEASNFLVEDSIFHSAATWGITLIGGFWSSKIRNNIIFNNNKGGIQLFTYSTTFAGWSQDNIIENNTIITSRYPNANFPTSGDPPVSPAIQFQNDATQGNPGYGYLHKRNTFRNNILINYHDIYDTYQAPFSANSIEQLQNNYFYNNVCYSTSGKNKIASYPLGGDNTYTLVEFEAAFEASDNQMTNPLLIATPTHDPEVSPGAFDFNLQLSSPALNAGTASNLFHDAKGRPRLIATPSAGANEYNSLVTLTVTDYSGITRTNDPVTTGIPLKEIDNILNTDNFKLINSSGTTVPANYTILSRWNGEVSETSKPIKWVLIDFLASVSASQSAKYYLLNTGGGSSSTSLSVSSTDPDYFQVTTGTAKFDLPRTGHFRLFNNVWIGTPPTTLVYTDSSSTAGLVLTDMNDTVYYGTIEGTPSIEENGSQRLVILLRGTFKTSGETYFAPSVDAPTGFPYFAQTFAYPNSFFYWQMRIHFYNGKDYAKAFLTVENNGACGTGYMDGTPPSTSWAPRQTVMFKSIKLVMPTALGTSVKTVDGQVTRNAGETIRLFQGWTENLGNGEEEYEYGGVTYSKGWILDTAYLPAYTLKRDSTTLNSGTTNAGYMDINASSTGIGFANRDFWQNWFKAIEVNDSNLTMSFWPAGGYYPSGSVERTAGRHTFYPGRHKTHEFAVGFYAGSQGTYASDLSAKINDPLMALSAPAWFADTKALGSIAPAGVSHGDTAMNTGMSRYDQQLRAMIDSTADETVGKYTLEKARNTIQIGSTLRLWRYWGWMNFGDYMHKNSEIYFNSNETFPYQLLLNYLRTGTRDFYRYGRESLYHHLDVDMYHGYRQNTSTGSHKYHNHLQRYFQETHSDNLFCDMVTNTPDPCRYALGEADEGAIPQHTWNEDMIFWYWLTGDRRAYDVISKIGEGIDNYLAVGGVYYSYVNNDTCRNDDTFAHINHLLRLSVNQYRLTGQSKYLTYASNLFTHILLYNEQSAGARGNFALLSTSGTVVYCLQGASCISPAPDPCSLCKNTETTFYLAPAMEGIIKLHEETENATVKSFIIRMADMLVDNMLFGGGTYTNPYLPTQMSNYWLESDKTGVNRKGAYDNAARGAPGFNPVFADFLAYAYKISGDNTYLDWARKAFRDFNLYGYTGKYGDESIDISYRWPITWGGGESSNGAPAIGTLARTGRSGLVYLKTEYEVGEGALMGMQGEEEEPPQFHRMRGGTIGGGTLK